MHTFLDNKFQWATVKQAALWSTAKKGHFLPRGLWINICCAFWALLSNKPKEASQPRGEERKEVLFFYKPLALQRAATWVGLHSTTLHTTGGRRFAAGRGPSYLPTLHTAGGIYYARGGESPLEGPPPPKPTATREYVCIAEWKDWFRRTEERRCHRSGLRRRLTGTTGWVLRRETCLYGAPNYYGILLCILTYTATVPYQIRTE